jgi:hypothetical protein
VVATSFFCPQKIQKILVKASKRQKYPWIPQKAKKERKKT